MMSTQHKSRLKITSRKSKFCTERECATCESLSKGRATFPTQKKIPALACASRCKNQDSTQITSMQRRQTHDSDHKFDPTPFYQQTLSHSRATTDIAFWYSMCGCGSIPCCRAQGSTMTNCTKSFAERETKEPSAS